MSTPATLDDPQQVVAMVQSLFETRSDRRAYDLLAQALTHHPDDPALLRELSRAELKLRHWQPAAEHAYAALAQQPHDSDAMRIYAVALSKLGRTADGLWMAWRAVTEDPNEYLTHHGYAALLHHANHHQQALTVLTEALRLAPDHPGIWALQGAVLRALGRVSDSDAAYRQALALQPDHADSIHDMALNRLRQHRVSAALNGFRGAARIDPNLGSCARTNIALALVTAMRRVTVVATFAGVPITAAAAQIEHQEPAVMARIIVVGAAATLLWSLIMVVRLASARTWRSTLRVQPFLGYRLTHILVTLAVAIVTALSNGPSGWIDLAGPAIVLAGLCISFSGRLHHM